MKGEKIFLRILEKEDIVKTQKWISDPEISEIMGYLPTFSLSNQYEWFEKVTNSKDRFIFAICLKKTNKHIGNVGLGNIDYIHRHAMLNIFIADRKNRHKGFGTETVKLILEFAFKRLNLNKVYLRTSVRFKEANSLYTKLGFKNDGLLREHYYTNGKYEDKIIYSILKREYIKN